MLTPEARVHTPGQAPGWSPRLAALLSLVIPGAGQMYKGQVLNGLAWLVLTVAGYICLIAPGLLLHLCCVIGAAAGKAGPTRVKWPRVAAIAIAFFLLFVFAQIAAMAAATPLARM